MYRYTEKLMKKRKKLVVFRQLFRHNGSNGEMCLNVETHIMLRGNFKVNFGNRSIYRKVTHKHSKTDTHTLVWVELVRARVWPHHLILAGKNFLFKYIPPPYFTKKPHLKVYPILICEITLNSKMASLCWFPSHTKAIIVYMKMPFSGKTAIFLLSLEKSLFSRGSSLTKTLHLPREPIFFGKSSAFFPPDFREDLSHEDAPWNFPIFLLAERSASWENFFVPTRGGGLSYSCRPYSPWNFHDIMHLWPSSEDDAVQFSSPPPRSEQEKFFLSPPPTKHRQTRRRRRRWAENRDCFPSHSRFWCWESYHFNF